MKLRPMIPFEDRKHQTSKRTGEALRLSVCMIVRDEEKLLPACLQSVAGIADELIIVDTGSNDGTIDQARYWGALIYHHPWENDFSKHRNQCLAYAQGRWILQLDADERLHADGAAEVRRLVERTDGGINSYLVEIHDCDRRGRRRGFFLFPRLFRNVAGAYYDGAVHNQLCTNATQMLSRVQIDHVGYDLDPACMQRKFERTRALLLRQLESDPHDAFALLNLTLSHAMHRDVDGVIEFGERLLARLQLQQRIQPVFVALFHPLAAAWLSKGNHERAQRLAKTLLSVVPDSPDSHHLLAWTALLQRDFAACLAYGAAFERSLRAWQSGQIAHQGVECHTLGRRSEVACWMGIAQIARGDLSAGQALVREGCKDPTFDEHTATQIMRLVGELHPEILIDCAIRCLHIFSQNVDFIFATLSILRESGGVQLMRDCLSMLDTEDLPRKGDAYQLAVLHLLRQDYERAAELLQRVGEDSPHFFEAQRQLVLCQQRTAKSVHTPEPPIARTGSE